MAIVTVNGNDLEIGDQERLNLIQAAQRAGVDVPHYCWHPALTVVASCRMCLVEVGDKKPDGTVAMQPKVVPACQTPAKNGTVIVTNSKKAKDAQAATLEYLLLNHPLDCPVCDQAGECFLQDYSYKFGRGYSRLKEDKLLRPDKDHIGANIALFTDRCVMCSRCVRFTREISGTAELEIINRGDHSEIDIFDGHACDNKLAGNVVDICPVGALCSKDFLYKQRVWFLQPKKSVCPNCSTGCSIYVDQNKSIVYRLRPRFNPQAQGHFMCDEGRFGYKYVNSKDRLTTPVVRFPEGENRELQVPWEVVLPQVRQELADAVARDPNSVAAVLSPWLTCEEAFLAVKLFQALTEASGNEGSGTEGSGTRESSVRLTLGPVQIVGEDDLYPKGPHGEPPPSDKVKFAIHAEKCPNRKGVEAVLASGGRQAAGNLDFATILNMINDGLIKTLYLFGGYPTPWLTDEQAEPLKKLDLLIVQDILPSPASAIAKYVLPGGTFAEKDGTFVNHAGLAQAIHAAIRPPGEARPDSRILMELLGRRGLFHAATVRKEMAAEVGFFAKLPEVLPDHGVFLT